MPFCRPDRIVRPVSWTLTAGTPLEDYGVDRLTDGDPSYPLRIAEPLIGLRADLGTPTRVDGIAIIHHNLAAGVRVRIRMGATPGAPDDSGSAIVPAWPGRFAPHLYADVAAALPNVADRTKQYVRVDTLDSNGIPVSIGGDRDRGRDRYVQRDPDRRETRADVWAHAGRGEKRSAGTSTIGARGIARGRARRCSKARRTSRHSMGCSKPRTGCCRFWCGR